MLRLLGVLLPNPRERFLTKTEVIAVEVETERS